MARQGLRAQKHLWYSNLKRLKGYKKKHTMDDIKAKQQLVEKIKDASNILVTVSDDPSVDALSAAIGLALLIDKLDKHATAVFSGVVPPAIAFLEPEKILDDTTDSLRDFIIALDKEKADHLRYKVEGEAVKIFITPYRTKLSSDDLEFSQGDYNVELVIALGVHDQGHLDHALESHGQILHDATVATITAGDQTSDLGGIDWHDDQASSLSEMLAGLAEALKPQKGKSLLDAPMATAFLTGIVAETERFSNRNTSSKSMTVASTLMAAGADQQLIATQLEQNSMTAEPEPGPKSSEPEAAPEEPAVETPKEDEDSISKDGTLHIGKAAHAYAHKDEAKEEAPDVDFAPSAPAEETLASLTPFETLADMDRRVKAHDQSEATEAAEEALQHASPAQPVEVPVPQPTAPTPAPESDPVAPIDMPNRFTATATSQLEESQEPSFGGSLNATTEEAAEEARREEASDQNKTILSHAYLGAPPQSDTAPGSQLSSATDESNSSYVLEGSSMSQPLAPTAPEPTAVQPPQPPTPADLGLPMPPTVPDFSGSGAPAPGPYAPPAPEGGEPARLGDIFAPEAPAGPAAPELPNPVTPDQPAAPEAPAPQSYDTTGPYAPPAANNDPSQFKIPGQ